MSIFFCHDFSSWTAQFTLSLSTLSRFRCLILHSISIRIKWIVPSNRISYHSKTISKQIWVRLKRTHTHKNDTENAKREIERKKNVWPLCWQNMHLANSKTNWKTNENEEIDTQIQSEKNICIAVAWVTRKTRRKEKSKLLRHEWIVRQGATARTMSTFYFIAFLVAKLDVQKKKKKFVRFSSFYVITLRVLTFFLELSLSLDSSSAGPFFSLFRFLFWDFYFRYAHSLWSFCSRVCC